MRGRDVVLLTPAKRGMGSGTEPRFGTEDVGTGAKEGCVIENGSREPKQQCKEYDAPTKQLLTTHLPVKSQVDRTAASKVMNPRRPR
jgi:hypothetical protein